MRRFQGEINQTIVSREEENIMRDVKEIWTARNQGEISDEQRKKVQELFEDLSVLITFHLKEIEDSLRRINSFYDSLWRIHKIFAALYLMSFLGVKEYQVKKRETRYLLKRNFPQTLQEIAKTSEIDQSETFKRDLDHYRERVDALADFLDEVLKMH